MFAIIVLILVNAMILRGMPSASGAPGAKKDWTVYGTMGCGWTRKQLDYMKGAGVGHTFVDCDKGGCPGTMDAFPTMVHTNGETVVGFKKV